MIADWLELVIENPLRFVALILKLTLRPVIAAGRSVTVKECRPGSPFTELP
jgi:hypothetical protein